MVTLYKRNNQGNPIYWTIKNYGTAIGVEYGVVGKVGHVETYNTKRKVEDEIKSRINAKRKEGYKELTDLYDNAPREITNSADLLSYLNSYLPKYNTTGDNFILPMLAKTLEDNKPWDTGHHFMCQWKINGLRCIIGAEKSEMDLFTPYKLTYTSREGVRWNLSWMDDIIIPKLKKELIDMMLEEGVCLDGELYLPGYSVNDINSFVKNSTLPQHYKLQYWCYDICVDNMSAIARNITLMNSCNTTNGLTINSKSTHLNNTEQFVLLPSRDVLSIEQATQYRDEYIDLGFEGLIMRDDAADYAFGKRNSSMWKYKRKEDGKFIIVDIVPEGRRTNLPKFVCRNDINDATFECTINKTHSVQEEILIHKDKYIGKAMLVEYRERSGVKQVPFHAKGINIII